jgi:hypothetical protein
VFSPYFSNVRLIILSGVLATVIFGVGCASHHKNAKPKDKPDEPAPSYPLKERVGETAVPTPSPTPAQGLLNQPLDPAGEPQGRH